MRTADASRPAWWRHRVRAMGSEVELRVLAAETLHPGAAGLPDDLGRLIDQRLAEMERCWSRFDPTSELSLLNTDPADEVALSPLLAAAMTRAVLAWRSTAGAFDPTTLDALSAAGYDRSFADLGDRPVPTSPGAPVPGCDAVDVRLREDGSGLLRRAPGVRLDLGGVGKGLAADLLACWLTSGLARSAYVSVGGDVRVAGDTPTGGWSLPVADPWGDGTLTTVVLDRPGAVVMSSTRRRRWQTDDGGWAHHLIDPATGRPAASGIAATVVVAAEAWWAESLAKAALVAGPVAGPALLRRHGVEGMLVGDDTEPVMCWGTGSGAGVDPAPQLGRSSDSSAASSPRELMPSLL